MGDEVGAKEGLAGGRRWGAVWLADGFFSLLHQQLTTEAEVPSVPRVNCGSCRRVEEGAALASIKCCDVTPRLPNFLVGEICAQAPHPVVTKWIEERRGDPYGFYIPPAVARAHLEARQEGRYGLACPLLVPGGGRCSIYMMRPALCVGYHCYYPDVMWQEAFSCLTSTLDLLQDAGARALVMSFPFDWERSASALASFHDEADIWVGASQREEVYSSLWQDWQGKELAFYINCYEKVQASPLLLREQMLSLQRQQLASRLQSASLPPAEIIRLERKLLDESDASGELRPIQPTERERLRYRQSAIPADQNIHSILQQEGQLLWYLQRLKVPRLWGRLRSLMSTEREQDARKR